MTKEEKQKLKINFKNREVVGGIFAIKNETNKTIYLDKSLNLAGSKNRFDFCRINDSCVHPRLQDAWKEFGKSAFSFEILERVVKKNAQTDASFNSKLEEFLEKHLEKNRDSYFVVKL